MGLRNTSSSGLMDPGMSAAACSSDATDWNLREVSFGAERMAAGDGQYCTSMGRVSSRSKLGGFSRGRPPKVKRGSAYGAAGAEARGRSLGSDPRGGPDGERGAWGANRDVEGVVLVLEGGGVKTPTSQTRGGREDTSCLDCVVRGGRGWRGYASWCQGCAVTHQG
ncbi:unnamed protein product [Boreogadus saida]